MTASAPSARTTTPPDLEHPEPVTHSDNEKSRMPERKNPSRKQRSLLWVHSMACLAHALMHAAIQLSIH